MKRFIRLLIVLGFVSTGLLHLLRPVFFLRIVPPGFPTPVLLVMISGICEIAGGLGLLSAKLRPAAGWGLIALLIAVFPANVYMAVHADRFSDLQISPTLLWLRLPMQLVFIAGVRWVSSNRTEQK